MLHRRKYIGHFRCDGVAGLEGVLERRDQTRFRPRLLDSVYFAVVSRVRRSMAIVAGGLRRRQSNGAGGTLRTFITIDIDRRRVSTPQCFVAGKGRVYQASQGHIGRKISEGKALAALAGIGPSLARRARALLYFFPACEMGARHLQRRSCAALWPDAGADEKRRWEIEEKEFG